MKGWLKLLVLGVIPILAVTTVAAQTATDKGSQLIFQANMAHKSFISVANAHDDRAVTLLTQYYNDEMAMVLWYLRIVLPNGNVLVDPFDHMIPGTATDDDMDGTNVSEVLGALPAMTNDDDGAGINSGHFVISVTAVAADLPADADADPPIVANDDNQANILFPAFLAEGMDDMGNIDEGGNNYPTNGTGVDRSAPTFAADDTEEETDTSSTNVGDLTVDTAMPVSFNHLTGHFTEALLSTDAGGGDQTASWGGTPVVRAAVVEATDALTTDDYHKLDGTEGTQTAAGGHLAELSAGGMTETITNAGARTDYTAPSDIADELDDATNRGINGGALVLPALHGGGGETKQIMLILSAADNYGGAGDYSLMAAKTGLMVSLMDGMGGALADPAAASGPVFGGVDDPETPPGTKIIVEGIQVMTDAGDCGGDMIMGPWTLEHLTSIVPSAMTGTDDFAGLDAELDPMMNASPGWIKFKRTGLSCEMDYGDGDVATGNPLELADGVPTEDERTYAAGTLIVEQEDSTRTFVTVGRALLKFITADSTFAASWTLKSPAN